MTDLTKYIGIPFVSHGRDMTGCDCWGLIRLFYLQELGIELPSYDALYDSALSRHVVHDAIAHNQHDWTCVQSPLFGDVVLIRSGRQADHVAVVLDPPDMLHVSADRDSCIERFNGPLYSARIVGFYRHAERNR